MKKEFLQSAKIIFNMSLSSSLFIFSPLSLFSQENKNQTLDNINDDLEFSLEKINFNQFNNIKLAEKSEKKSVLIAEIIINGLEGHPEEKKLELAAYDAISIRPGSVVTRTDVKKNIESIYKTGFFSGISIEPLDSELGVKLIIKVDPNPILRSVAINQSENIISNKEINKIFREDYGKTLNFNSLNQKIKEIKKFYFDNGYSLARIQGPKRLEKDGSLLLEVNEGIVSDIQISFINAEGETTDEKGNPIRGKTKDWVIRRELETKPGSIFNRKILEADINRLYKSSLFSDIKVALNPDQEQKGKIIILLAIIEQRTGSLTGGLGYSNGQGIFAQIGLQETNAFGRAWSTNINLNYGEYATTYNFSISDPWIKGDKFRTSFRTNFYLSRDYPQVFKSDKNGRIRGVSDFYKASGTSIAKDISTTDSYATVAAARTANATNSFFDYKGNTIALERVGGGFLFGRPLNGGNPFKKAPWRIFAGMNFKQVKMIDNKGNLRPYGIANGSTSATKDLDEVICIGYSKKDGSCPSENVLVSFTGSASRNKLNDSVNPTSGNILRFTTEQFISVGNNSPTFNKARASYSWFYPMRLIKLTKGCKANPNDNNFDCLQTIGFHVQAGSIVGELPPYEAYCMGGSSSVRGWSACEMSVSRSFAEASAEYRFPVWRMLSGALFADAGSDLGSQNDVPGKPGELLNKPGSGFSLGGGIGVKTPIGPLRLDIASKDLSGKWRYTLGVGWKF
tara:strand:- start:12195 stop:14408 length:2214 start_codon:yes stop_codon:yes gene_type:complete